MLLANLEKLCLQQCCAKRYLLSCRLGLYVCLPGSLSGALVVGKMIINVSIINRKPTAAKLKFVSGW